MASANDKLLSKIKACAKAAFEAEASQRQREKEDLAFQIPDNQWDAKAKKYRQGTATSPGRPMLSVSLLSQPMALIQNQAVAAHLGVEIHPVSEKADPEVAEIKQGLYRRIERDSNAPLARLWALDRAKQCGRGWYRVTTQWDEDGDDPFDQEIVIERILNQDSVYIDPSAQKPDFSDAKWVIVATWLTEEDFEDQFPGKKFPTTDSEWRAWNESEPAWVKLEGTKATLIVEYLYKVPVKEEVKGPKGRTRQRERMTVKIVKCSAREILEDDDWNGQYIPLIPVIGTELQPFDGKRMWEGMVRKARDAQKFFNHAISTLVERMAMEPKVPWVMAEGQARGHEEEWDLANVENRPRLEYSPVDFKGNLVPPPQRAQIDSSGMSLALMALDQARQFVQSATSVYAPSLGEVPQERSAQSGRAILALQQQSDAGTSHFLQNLANISMQYEARVVLDLMPKVYDRPGRVVQILGGEDEPRMVMLNAPFVPGQGPKDRPQPIPSGMPPPPNTKVYDLNRGKYTVSVSVGKSYQTRLQEGATEIGQVLQAAPQLMTLIGPTYFRFRDFPGAKEIADVLKKVWEKEIPGLDGEEGQEPTPEQLKGQIEQMGQQMQQMQAALQQAIQKLETEQAKQEAAMAKAQLDAQTRVQTSQADNVAMLEKARMDNETKILLEKLSLELEAMKAMLGARQQEMNAEHRDRMADRGERHEAMMTMATMEPPEPLKEPLDKEE